MADTRLVLPRRGRKLRIALVTENFMPKVDGVTRTLARLLVHLREQGHECIVLGPESGMSYYETHPLIGTAGIPLVVYPGLKLNFLRPRFLRAIKEFVRISFSASGGGRHLIIDEQDPDVIHVVDPVWLGGQFLLALDAGWCGPEWSGPDRRPVVASYHTNLPNYATLFGWSWLEPIMWNMLQRLHTKCVLTACPSISTLENLRDEHGFNNLRIWPRGVDLTVFSPLKRSSSIRERLGATRSTATSSADMSSLTLGDAFIRPFSTPPRTPPRLGQYKPLPWPQFPLTPPHSPPLSPVEEDLVVILYVGRISYEKNLQLLISAFAQLVSQQTPDDPIRLRLVLVGDGPHRSALEESVQARGIAEFTTFTGQISQPAELAAWYASADVFAFPSFTETFGQVVCEALASGLPVVGLDAPGTRDLVQHGQSGLLMPRDGDTKSYAVLLHDLVHDGARRRRMGAAAARSTHGKTWPAAMEKMIDCYREAVDQYDSRQSGCILRPSRRGPTALHTAKCPCPIRELTLCAIITFGLLVCFTCS